VVVDAGPQPQHIFDREDSGGDRFESIELRREIAADPVDGFQDDAGNVGDDQQRQQVVEDARRQASRLLILEHRRQPLAKRKDRLMHRQFPVAQQTNVVKSYERFLMA
jgi:hypothetical protein